MCDCILKEVSIQTKGSQEDLGKEAGELTPETKSLALGICVRLRKVDFIRCNGESIRSFKQRSGMNV